MAMDCPHQKPPPPPPPAIKKGSWTPSEDALLLEFVEKYGESNWNTAHLLFPELRRGGKSCRMRYRNQLRHGLRKGPFSPAEQIVVARGVSLYGNQWSKIADMLPGRTDNSVKNYWNVRLKRLKRQQMMEEASKRARHSATGSASSSSSASSFVSGDEDGDKGASFHAFLGSPALQQLPSSIRVNAFQMFSSDVQELLQRQNSVHTNGVQQEMLAVQANAPLRDLPVNVVKREHSASTSLLEAEQEEEDGEEKDEEEFTSVCILNVPHEEEFPSVQISSVPIPAGGRHLPLPSDSRIREEEDELRLRAKTLSENKALASPAGVEGNLVSGFHVCQDLLPSSAIGGVNPFSEEEEEQQVVRTNGLHNLHTSVESGRHATRTIIITPQDKQQLPSVQTSRYNCILVDDDNDPVYVPEAAGMLSASTPDKDLLEAFAQSSSSSGSSSSSLLTDCFQDLIDFPDQTPRSSSWLLSEPPLPPRCFDFDLHPFVNGTLDSLVISSSSAWRSMPSISEASWALGAWYAVIHGWRRIRLVVDGHLRRLSESY